MLNLLRLHGIQPQLKHIRNNMKIRIISGSLKGRSINTPSGHKTHPMGEKIRGAIFNILGDITGLSVFDCFAGSGAVSLEAASRGARSITAVEVDKHAYNIISENISLLACNDIVKISRANISRWSENNSEKKYDIVIIDPPYHNIKTKLISTLIIRHVSDGGIAVLSLPSNVAVDIPQGFLMVQQKMYGNASLLFLKRNTLEK